MSAKISKAIPKSCRNSLSIHLFGTALPPRVHRLIRPRTLIGTALSPSTVHLKFSLGTTPISTLTQEQKGNYVPASFLQEVIMFRAFVEEAAALTSLALFVGMIAVWAQLIATL